MDYIEVDKFLEKSKEVQEILKKYHNKYHKVVCGKGIPLIAETELRSFIQEKLDAPNINYCAGELVIEYEINKGPEDCDVADYSVECDDMLEGYWKIACMIADNEVKEAQMLQGLNA